METIHDTKRELAVNLQMMNGGVLLLLNQSCRTYNPRPTSFIFSPFSLGRWQVAAPLQISECEADRNIPI